MSFLSNTLSRALTRPSPFNQTIRTKVSKAGGSTTNGRDSPGKRLGIKVWSGLQAKPGSIIVRQRGQKFRPGCEHVRMGRDHTIYSTSAGKVHYTRWEHNKKYGKNRVFVHVVPPEEQEAAATAQVAASV